MELAGFIFILMIFFGFLLVSSLKQVNQYERGIVLTLGVYSYTLGPGLKLVFPILQCVIKVDIRINTLDIPKQEIITKDNVAVSINAVYTIENATNGPITPSSSPYRQKF